MLFLNSAVSFLLGHTSYLIGLKSILTETFEKFPKCPKKGLRVNFIRNMHRLQSQRIVEVEINAMTLAKLR